jgi:Malectin domain
MYRILAIAGVCLGLSLPVMAQQQPIRIKCGGPSYTDTKGNVWEADRGFNTGTASDIPATVSGTSDQGLFQSGRWTDSTTMPLTYSFQVANGPYHVNLYFTETYPGLQSVGARIFNVKMQGNVVFNHLDVFAEAGGFAALIKGAEVQVSNGRLTIEFDNIVSHAKVNAIEIVPGQGGPSLSLNFQYPDGKPVSGTLAYVVSSSLINLKGSAPLSNGQAQATLFASPSALGISTQFQVTLSLTDTAGHLLWQINLGMNPANINFGAVQSSALNVIVQRL